MAAPASGCPSRTEDLVVDVDAAAKGAICSSCKDECIVDVDTQGCCHGACSESRLPRPLLPGNSSCHSSVNSQPEAPQASKQDMLKLRYTNSLDSATQWRRNLRQRPISRFFSSAMTMVSLSMGVLVLGSILGIRILSGDVISSQLQSTSEEGQLAGVDQVSKEVLSFFQIASSQARVTTKFHDIAFHKFNETAPQKYFELFGKTEWSSLTQSVHMNDLQVSQARDPDLVARSGYSECNMDTVLIGLTYFMNVFNETSALSPEAFNESMYPEKALGPNAQFSLIQGIQGNPANPLAFYVPYGPPTPCALTNANAEFMWGDFGFTGSVNSSDTGLRAAEWQRGVQVVAVDDVGSTLILRGVVFNLTGPSWAPRSAFGRATIRVADSTAIFGDVNLQSRVKDIASRSRNKPIVFLITQEGDLMASSLPSQQIELREGAASGNREGPAIGLVRADDPDRVMAPIQPVAKTLIDKHCAPDASGLLAPDGRALLDCHWDGVEELQYIVAGGDEYAVVLKKIDDPLASGLNILVVDMVQRSLVTAPVDEIEDTLWLLLFPIVLGATLMFSALSRQMTVPLRNARDNMFLLGDMKIEEALEQYSGSGCCGRPLFTEASDLRLSFLHAANALRNWRLKEIERRTLLEQERSQRIRQTVEKAVQGAGKLMHPMVVISAETFMQLPKLTSYEELRNSGKLVFLDTEEDLSRFKTNHSVIFLSHQWLAWGFPDDEEHTHLKAMKSAVKTSAQQMRSSGARCAWKNLYVWVDYASIAQEHRGMQTLAVSSLPVYASSADVFVIVAPPAKHAQSQDKADLNTYNSRGWCRAEMLAKICSSGLENFFVLSTQGGELQRVTEEWLPSLSMYVFEGEFSCCQQGHQNATCDKEALVEPVLGLYSLVLRQSHGINAPADTARRHMDPVLRHIRQSKERFFPRTYTYAVTTAEGVPGPSEERELFGPLVEELEAHMDRELGLMQRSDSGSSIQRQRSKVFWVF